MEITVHEQDIIRAASEGMDAFLMLIHDRIMEGIGGRLDDTTMPLLNGNQVTLLAYVMFREEVMDGGFVPNQPVRCPKCGMVLKESSILEKLLDALFGKRKNNN